MHLPVVLYTLILYVYNRVRSKKIPSSSLAGFRRNPQKAYVQAVVRADCLYPFGINCP